MFAAFNIACTYVRMCITVCTMYSMYLCTFHLRRSRPCRNCGCERICRRRKITDEGDTEEGETTYIDSHFAMDDNPILYTYTLAVLAFMH